MTFVLQQNTNCTETGWTDTTNAPVLNLTTLQYEATVPLEAGKRFYRLINRD
jgi:hypothetical protein